MPPALSTAPHSAIMPPSQHQGLGSWPISAWALAAVLLITGLWMAGGTHQPEWMVRVHQHPVMPDAFWASLTLLGFGWAVVIVVAALDRHSGAFTAAAVLSLTMGGGLIQLVKNLWPLPRPALILGEDHLTVIGVTVQHSGSMPSGHAAAAAALATLVVLVLHSGHRLTLPRLMATATLGALAAWSRVAVGAHWPADVLVGAAAGVPVTLACTSLATHWLRAPTTAYGQRQRFWWLCAIELGAAAVCFGTDTGQPSAWWVQGLLGSLGLASCLHRLHTHARQPRP